MTGCWQAFCIDEELPLTMEMDGVRPRTVFSGVPCTHACTLAMARLREQVLYSSSACLCAAR